MDVNSCRVDKRLILDEDNDPNHFDPSYFGKGRVWHTPNTDLMLMHYRLSKQKCDEWGIEIYNAGEGGALDVFPRVRLLDAISEWK